MTGLIRYVTLGVAGAALLAPAAFAQTATQPKQDRRPAATAAAVASPAAAPMLDRATGVGLVPLKGKINDGTRLKGRRQGGGGNCGGRYCDPQMDDTFDVSVLQ